MPPAQAQAVTPQEQQLVAAAKGAQAPVVAEPQAAVPARVVHRQAPAAQAGAAALAGLAGLQLEAAAPVGA